MTNPPRNPIPDHKTAFGDKGELYVVEKLRGLGYDVEHKGGPARFDILVNGRARFEVKSAHVGPGSRGWGWLWQFAFNRHGATNDFAAVVLNCYDDDAVIGSFVIPGEYVRQTLTRISITRRDPAEYAGKWSPFWEAWEDVARIVGEADVFVEEDEEEEEIPF